MATRIHPSRSCLPPFYTIPIFYSLRNILPEGICCCLHTCCLYNYRVVGIVLCIIYICNFHCYYGPVIGIFKDRLPEAICCCLQTCSVNVVLLVMCCMCIPVFVVTSADISHIFMLFTCLRLDVVYKNL